MTGQLRRMQATAASHPPGAVAAQAGDAHAEADLGAGVSGRVDQDRVEQGAAWGVQRVDAGMRLDRHLDAVRAVVKDAAPYRGCACVDYLVLQTPSGEL